MRKSYIDNIRWTTVLSVWFYHVFYTYNSCGVLGGIGSFRDSQPQDAVLYVLYPWFMALLFLVAGISAKSYLETHTDKEFIKTRSVKLLVPSTIGVFVFGWVQGYVSMSLGGAFKTLSQVPKGILFFIMCLSGIGVLWFIQLLWVLSLILVVIRKIENGRLLTACKNIPSWGVIALIIPYYLFAQILNTPVITVYRIGLYGFAFLIGYYVFSHEEVVDKLVRICIPLIAISCVLGIAFTTVNFGNNYADNPVFNSPLSMAFSYTAILAILGGFKKWGNKSSKFASFMNKKAWGFYMFHYLGISLVALIIGTYGGIEIGVFSGDTASGILIVLIYFASAIGGLITGFIVPEAVSRIPVIRWCVMGIKRK